MAHSPETHRVFFVEHFLPGFGADQLLEAVHRLDAAAADDSRLVDATILPSDESVLCLVAAPSEDHARGLCTRAGLTADRISPAIGATPPTTRRRN